MITGVLEQSDPGGNVDTRLSCMPNWTGRTRADISGLECGQNVGRSYGGIHISPCRVVLWHFHLGCHLQLRPRMQVRRGTAHAFKILHCNHTENGSADWWTALHVLLGQTRLSIGANELKAMSIRLLPYRGTPAQLQLLPRKSQRDYYCMYPSEPPDARAEPRGRCSLRDPERNCS